MRMGGWFLMTGASAALTHMAVFTLVTHTWPTCIPEFANAAMDFSSVKNLLKDIVSFLIFDIGYYLGILAIVVQGFRAKSGRVEWSTFGWTVAGVFLVFFAPNIVAEIKSGAATSLQ